MAEAPTLRVPHGHDLGHSLPLSRHSDGDVDAARTRVWTINGDFVGLAPNGVARYAREVTQALDRLVCEAHPLARSLKLRLVAPRDTSDLGLKAVAGAVVPEFKTLRMPQVWAQLQLPRHVQGGLLSFCNLAPVAVRKQIVCIHDLHTRLMPESYGFGFRAAHRVILPMLGRRVRAVTTVSSLSKSHLVNYGVAAAEKVHVTYNGADHASAWRPERSSLRFNGRRPFVFGLARGQAYKNTELFWKLAPELDAMGVDIVLAGDIDAATVEAFGPKPINVSLLGRISDDDLAAALQAALCFVFPSRIEGFGLPAVEAMTWGCPVVAASAPCIPEVCGAAALYAGPDDVGGWAAAVQSLTENERLRHDLVVQGRRRAQDFSWRAIALTYLKLMAEIDGVGAPAQK